MTDPALQFIDKYMLSMTSSTSSWEGLHVLGERFYAGTFPELITKAMAWHVAHELSRSQTPSSSTFSAQAGLLP
jgi:hypothetical protein